MCGVSVFHLTHRTPQWYVQEELRELRGAQEVMLRVARGIVVGGGDGSTGDDDGPYVGSAPPTFATSVAAAAAASGGVPLTTFQETVTELQMVKVTCQTRGLLLTYANLFHFLFFRCSGRWSTWNTTVAAPCGWSATSNWACWRCGCCCGRTAWRWAPGTWLSGKRSTAWATRNEGPCGVPYCVHRV